VDCSEVGRFVLVRVMAEVLKRLFQINFNFIEGFNGVDPAHAISTQIILGMRSTISLGRMRRTQFDGVSSGHDGCFRVYGMVSFGGWWLMGL
jgi:hypothetical protein